jgi:uncharacterized protein (TIGR02246 family)
MSPRNLGSLLVGATLLVPVPSQGQLPDGLDAYWAEVSRTVADGDFRGYASLYHPDAVLVSLPSGTSVPIARALEGWEPGFVDVREGRAAAEVEFRFTRRLHDAASAHETGIFRYSLRPRGGEASVATVHFEALLVRVDGAWRMLMEYQKGPAPEEAWDAAGESTEAGRGAVGSGPAPRPEDTEVWEPVPRTVRPGRYAGPTSPPDDAIVLFDGSDLSEWVNVRDNTPAGWTVADGVVTVDKSVGDIQTRRRFRDYQLHLEWRVPEEITGEGQARGNSGLYLAFAGDPPGGYELQILDSYGNATYVNGMAGSVYKQHVPLANPARPPGSWQTYDVLWTAPRFNEEGVLESPARVTALFNGVVVQNDVVLKGRTLYRGVPVYRPHGEAPIMLQAHGDPSPPISFRNIWVRPLR